MTTYDQQKRNKGIFQIICILIGCILILSIFIHPVNAVSLEEIKRAQSENISSFDGSIYALKEYFNVNISARNVIAGDETGNINNVMYSTSIGYHAGYNNTANSQSAFGYGAGNGNTAGGQVAFGQNAGQFNTGSSQTAVGYGSGSTNSGDYTTTIGYYAGRLNTKNYFTAIGYYAGAYNTGSRGIAIGYQSGYANTATDNILLGYQAKSLNVSNQLIIMDNGVNTKPLIQGNFSSGLVRFPNYGAGTLNTDANGVITAVSDEKAKSDIKAETKGVSTIQKINPISYKYKEGYGLDTQNTYLGFSAQDLEKAIPEAVYSKKDYRYEVKNIKTLMPDGEIIDDTETIAIPTGTTTKTVSDRAIIAVLINAVKEQQKEIDELKKMVKG